MRLQLGAEMKGINGSFHEDLTAGQQQRSLGRVPILSVYEGFSLLPGAVSCTAQQCLILESATELASEGVLQFKLCPCCLEVQGGSSVNCADRWCWCSRCRAIGFKFSCAEHSLL